MEYRINGGEMTSPKQAHGVIAAAMGFPGYYGNNLDALWDMLTTANGTAIVYNVSGMLNALGGYGCKMLAVFFEAAEKNPGFDFRTEG